MGAKNKAAEAARAARDNPYVQRLVEDDDLRDNLARAYESAKDAYSRLHNGKSPAKAIFDDKKLQKDLKRAADALKEATIALREAPRKQKSGGGFMRKLMLVAVAGGLALALSEGLRKKVLDALFGAEEEFEYTSTTTAPGAGATGGSTASSATTAASTN